MSDQVQIELIKNIPAILTAAAVMASAVFTYLTSRHAKDAKEISAQTLVQSQANHEQINGFLEKRDTEKAEASENVGVLREKGDEAARVVAAAAALKSE